MLAFAFDGGTTAAIESCQSLVAGVDGGWAWEPAGRWRSTEVAERLKLPRAGDSQKRPVAVIGAGPASCQSQIARPAKSDRPGRPAKGLAVVEHGTRRFASDAIGLEKQLCGKMSRTTRLPRMTESLPLHETWRRMYRQRRYCQHLSQTELYGRVRDVFLTLLTLTPEAKVGLLPMDPHGMRWMQLWTDVLEEMAIRFGPYPAGFTREILHSEPLPDFVGPLASRAAASLNHVSPAGVAIKFGKSAHMRALYERGALRVQPASFYRKPDHNGAVRDDELALEVSLSLQREHIIKLVTNPQDVPPGAQYQRLDLHYESSTDYWIYCVTTAVQPRTFVDFGADACVVIKDPYRFLVALDIAIAPHVEGAKFRHGKVAYIDPLLPATASLDVPMSKHFRYAYQHEYRFAWVPSDERESLGHIDVELGTLREYAELITLPATSSAT